jgi:hypothetical protein
MAVLVFDTTERTFDDCPNAVLTCTSPKMRKHDRSGVFGKWCKIIGGSKKPREWRLDKQDEMKVRKERRRQLWKKSVARSGTVNRAVTSWSLAPVVIAHDFSSILLESRQRSGWLRYLLRQSLLRVIPRTIPLLGLTFSYCDYVPV